jgi:hypothetical protein
MAVAGMTTYLHVYASLRLVGRFIQHCWMRASSSLWMGNPWSRTGRV